MRCRRRMSEAQLSLVEKRHFAIPLTLSNPHRLREVCASVLLLLQAVFPNCGRRLIAITACQATAAAAEASIVTLLVPLLGSIGSTTVDIPLPRLISLESLRISFSMLLAALSAAFVIRALAQTVAVMLWSAGVERYETFHRARLLGGLLRASYACQSREPSGRLQHVLTHHGECTARAFTALAWGGAHLVQVTCLLLGAWLVSPVPALVSAVALVSTVALLRPLTRFVSATAKRRADALARYVHLIGQSSALFQELRIFGATPACLRRAEVASTMIARERRRQNTIGSLLPTLYQTALGLFLLSGVALLYWSGAPAGTAPIVSLLLLLRATSAAQYLHTTYHQLQDARPALQEMIRLEDEYAAAAIPAGGLPLHCIDRLELRGVDFAYDPGQPVLSDVRLQVERGDVIAVVGPSGAGKSTLIQLLLGLRSPDRGQLIVNGSPAELFRSEDFYARTAFVAQEPAFFNEPIEACIRFGRSDMTDREVVVAAENSGLLAEIEKGPNGFAASVGERGESLSLGQRQRLSIARALVGRPDLLILDEPTAALDAESEQQIIATLKSLRGRAITFVVTHRPALLRACNKVLRVADREVAFVSNSQRMPVGKEAA